MEATKITFSDRTRAALQNPTLPRNKIQELRRMLVIEHIKSKPNGSTFRTEEINKAAFPPGHPRTNVLKFVKAMQRDGVINIEPIPKSYKYILTVNDATTVAKPKAPKLQPIWSEDGSPRPETSSESRITLNELAKEFAWKHNSDSLREFVKYMDGKELDLRRMVDGGVIAK